MFLDNFFLIFHHKGIWGGQKVDQHGKKFVKKILKKMSNQGAKRNKKMGGRSHVIIFDVFPFKNGTL